MSKLTKPRFSFTGYIVEKAEIDIKNIKVGKKINFTFTPSGELNKIKRTFELKLGINITESNQALIINLQAKAFFIFENDIEDNSLQNYMIYNAPALLFPYIRAYISTLSSLSGVPTIILPTLNMSNLTPILVKNLKIITEE